MSPILLIDGNNLGHVLGYIDKAAGRYDSAGLLTCLDGVARFLATQGQEIKIVLFLDDPSAAERLGGWHVQVAPVPGGNADAAIRAYAQAHGSHWRTLVSDDQALCGDVAMWGVVCLSPRDFVSRYLIPARRAGFSPHEDPKDKSSTSSYDEPSEGGPPTAQALPSHPFIDRGQSDRLRHIAALERAGATLRGEPPLPPEVYKLDLSHWEDAAELSLYLAEHHLCPEHTDLTDPEDIISAMREHCCCQPRFLTSGRVIDRVFRLFVCRPEHTLSLDDLARLSKTRRRKIRAAIQKQGERLGITVAW